MIKIIPEYGVNAVTLSYECIGVNELSHVWYDPYGNELGTDDTVTVYENGIYSIEITDLNNNKFKGYYINNTPIFEIGCGYSATNGSLPLILRHLQAKISLCFTFYIGMYKSLNLVRNIANLEGLCAIIITPVHIIVNYLQIFKT